MPSRAIRIALHRSPLLVICAVTPACSGSSGNTTQLTPKETASTVSVALPDPCAIATNLRAKVKPFLEEGRLHRAVGVIQKADKLCPQSAHETWAALVTTLADLGRYDESRQVVGHIDADANAPTEAKGAAKDAKEKCDKLDRVFPDTEDAKKEMKRLYLEALAADAEAPKIAKEKYLAAWEAWRPNGQALLSAGFAAKKLGQKAEAQRLFDRAIVDGEKAQHAPVKLDVPNGFGGLIEELAWSKDGRRLAVAHGDEISVFDSTWREKYRLRGNWRKATSLTFLPDGKSVVVAKIGKETTPSTESKDSLVAVAYSPDGKTMASASREGAVKLQDVATGREIRILDGQFKGISSLTYFPDGKMLASGGADKAVRLWNTSTGKLVRSIGANTESIRSLTISPDGQAVAFIADDGVAREWNVATGKLVHEMPGQTVAMAYSPRGQFLALGSGDTVQLWDTTTKRSIAELQKTGDAVTSLAYSPDGQTLAVGVEHYLVSHRVLLWNTTNRTLTRTLEEHTSYHESARYSPRGETLASGFADGTVRVWNVGTGRYRHTFYGHREAVRTLVYSPDGKTIASGSSDMTVRLWDLERGRTLDKLEGHAGPVAVVAYSPDGKTLSSHCAYGDYGIHLWDEKTGKLAHRLEGHMDSIWAEAFSPDGKTVATASYDQTVRIWNVSEGKLVHLLKGHRDVVTSLAYSPDGKTLASGATDGIARLWDVATGKPLHNFDASAFPHGSGNWFSSIRSLAYLDDGRTIAVRMDGRSLNSAADDVTAVWDLSNGKVARTIEGRENEVFWGKHSPRDNTVLLDDRDPHSIHIRRLDNETVRAELRAIANRDAAYARVPSGHLDFYGADACEARQYPICRIGDLAWPLEVCEERFYVPGLLAYVHNGDSSYLEPENAPVLMNCAGQSR